MEPSTKVAAVGTFSRKPPLRSSRTTTRCPSARHSRATCAPMKPAPPVTSETTPSDRSVTRTLPDVPGGLTRADARGARTHRATRHYREVVLAPGRKPSGEVPRAAVIGEEPRVQAIDVLGSRRADHSGSARGARRRRQPSAKPRHRRAAGPSRRRGPSDRRAERAARRAVVDDIRDAAHPCGHHSAARGHGLDERHRRSLVARRQHDEIEVGVDPIEVSSPPEKGHRRFEPELGNQALELGAPLAVADDEEPGIVPVLRRACGRQRGTPRGP